MQSYIVSSKEGGEVLASETLTRVSVIHLLKVFVVDSNVLYLLCLFIWGC